MSSGLWLALCQADVAANLPTALSEFPSGTFCYFYATDTRVLYMWDPKTATWSPTTTPPQLVAAAGATQGGATAIKANLAIVNAYATTTHNGVQLTVPVTGREVTVVNGTGGGVKVYPSAHCYISSGASNIADATVLKPKHTNTYIAVDTSHWTVQRGA